MSIDKPEIDLSRYLDRDSIRINTDNVDKALSRVPSLLRYELMDAYDHIRKGFFKALYANTGLKNKRFIATKNAGIGKYLRVYRNPRKGGILDIELGIFSRSKIVKLHELGGTVESKSKMTIPFGESLDGDGKLKKWFRGSKKSYQNDELFVLKTKGKAYLAKRSQGKLLFYFVLRDKIKFEPRLRFYDTWNHMEGYRRDILNKAVEKAVDKA